MGPMTTRFFILDSPQKRDRVAALIGKLPPDVVWDIQVKEYEPKRSDEANRRLWALHSLAAQHTGHASDELHELMKWKFLPRTTVKIAGQETEVPARSSRLTKKQFAAFMEQVEAFYISQLGIFLGDDR